MFSGLMSRWTTPWRWAWSSARAISRTICRASAGASERLGDAVAGQELHAQVGLAVVAADVVDADDVPVHQARGGARFAGEAFGSLRVFGQPRSEQLQGDFAPE